jgi:hypothetical protein
MVAIVSVPGRRGTGISCGDCFGRAAEVREQGEQDLTGCNGHGVEVSKILTRYHQEGEDTWIWMRGETPSSPEAFF